MRQAKQRMGFLNVLNRALKSVLNLIQYELTIAMSSEPRGSALLDGIPVLHHPHKAIYYSREAIVSNISTKGGPGSDYPGAASAGPLLCIMNVL